MQLTELLKQITPLPYQVIDDIPRTRHFTSSVEIDSESQDSGSGICHLVSSRPPLEVKHTAAYMAHAANVLPELVQAMEEVVDSPDYRNIHTHEMNRAIAALSIAKFITTQP